MTNPQVLIRVSFKNSKHEQSPTIVHLWFYFGKFGEQVQIYGTLVFVRIHKTRTTKMSAGPPGTKEPMDNGDVNDDKGGAEDAKPVQVVVEEAKPENSKDDVKDAKDDDKGAKSSQDDVKDAKDDDKGAKSSQDDVKDAKDDDKGAKSSQDDVKDAKDDECDKKRKNSLGSCAVEKKGKKTKRAWLIDVACAFKQDIKCIDLPMSDPFGELKKNYFARGTTLQMVVVNYKQKGQKKKNLAFCFDEEGVYTCKQNLVMAGICREIWPDPQSNPFSHGAFGSYVLYYSGSVSGASSSDMPPVTSIDEVIERLCESN